MQKLLKLVIFSSLLLGAFSGNAAAAEEMFVGAEDIRKLVALIGPGIPYASPIKMEAFSVYNYSLLCKKVSNTYFSYLKTLSPDSPPDSPICIPNTKIVLKPEYLTSFKISWRKKDLSGDEVRVVVNERTEAAVFQQLRALVLDGLTTIGFF